MPRYALPETAFPVSNDMDAGLKFYAEGHYTAAIYCYRLALSRDPESALGHYLMGLTLMALGDPISARAEWEAASCSEDATPQTVWASSRARLLLEHVLKGSQIQSG
ncbi:MAG: tetratricopeptide repeat protein [Janthinobacterium lividum]